jgi:hypothetical protein
MLYRSQRGPSGLQPGSVIGDLGQPLRGHSQIHVYPFLVGRSVLPPGAQACVSGRLHGATQNLRVHPQYAPVDGSATRYFVSSIRPCERRNLTTNRPTATRFATRGAMLVVAYLVVMVVVFVTGISTGSLAAFLAGLVVAWLWRRVWRWSDGEAYGGTQKAAPPGQPEG